MCWHPFKWKVHSLINGGKSLWVQQSGLPLFFSLAPFPQAFPLPSNTTVWRRRRLWAEGKKGQNSRALPVSQRSAWKGLSVSTRKLNLSWASWTGWQPISLLPGPKRNSPQFCVTLHEDKMLCRNSFYMPSFTFLHEQIKPGFSRGSRDRGQRGPNWYLLCQKLTGLFGKTETK